MTWEYPVFREKAEEVEGSFAKKKRKALSREEAIAFIAGDDPRPLLVLRECKVCNGTDDALLKGGIDNEKTFLLAQWFHCVKLPVDTLEEDHPFHALFKQKEPEHLFVCSPDGANHAPLESQTSRTELWKSMRKVLAEDYKKKPDSALKKLAGIIDKLDVVDTRLNELLERRDEILEEDGPKSKKLPKLQKKISKAEAERADLREDFTAAAKLELKRRES